MGKQKKIKNISPLSTQPVSRQITKATKGRNSLITSSQEDYSQTILKKASFELLSQDQNSKPQEDQEDLNKSQKKETEFNRKKMTKEQQMSFLFQKMESQGQLIAEQGEKIAILEQNDKDKTDKIFQQKCQLEGHLKQEQISILGELYVRLRDKIFGELKNYPTYLQVIENSLPHIQEGLKQEYQERLQASGFTEYEMIALADNYQKRNKYCHDLNISKLNQPLFSSEDAHGITLITICLKITDEKEEELPVYSYDYAWKTNWKGVKKDEKDKEDTSRKTTEKL